MIVGVCVCVCVCLFKHYASNQDAPVYSPSSLRTPNSCVTRICYHRQTLNIHHRGDGVGSDERQSIYTGSDEGDGTFGHDHYHGADVVAAELRWFSFLLLPVIMTTIMMGW